ncbi:MAG: hypothetical protein ACFE94_06100 [Candidatus Hodarchaeota archaeon]
MKFTDKEKEILEEVSDQILKQRALELRSLYLNVLEQDKEPSPQLKQQFIEVFSQYDPALMRYLLANLGYLRYFSIAELKTGDLDNVFHGLCVDINILELYDAFASLPVEYFTSFVDKFGFGNDYYIGKLIEVNIIHVEGETFRKKELQWKVMVYVDGLPVEDVSFSKPTRGIHKVSQDLKSVINQLKKWVDNNFNPKFFSKSLAIPILKKLLGKREVEQVLDNYKK